MPAGTYTVYPRMIGRFRAPKNTMFLELTKMPVYTYIGDTRVTTVE